MYNKQKMFWAYLRSIYVYINIAMNGKRVGILVDMSGIGHMQAFHSGSSFPGSRQPDNQAVSYICSTHKPGSRQSDNQAVSYICSTDKPGSRQPDNQAVSYMLY